MGSVAFKTKILKKSTTGKTLKNKTITGLVDSFRHLVRPDPLVSGTDLELKLCGSRDPEHCFWFPCKELIRIPDSDP
jgi:hypothetical protein